jgi:predicted RNA-binding Zn ribbon-like protein
MHQLLDGSARTAAERAVALIEALQPHGDVDLQVAGAEVRAVLLAYGEPEPLQLGPQDVQQLRAVAGELWPVFAAANTAEAAGVLNALLARHATVPRLTDHHGRTPWHLHADRTDDEPWPVWFAASSTMALANLLSDHQANPGGICASPTCGRPFLVSVSSRRYCSTRCGTRERVAQHRRASIKE